MAVTSPMALLAGLLACGGAWAWLRHLMRRIHAAEAHAQQLYHTHFDEAPIAMLQEDWSGVKALVDQLVASGVEDLEGYLKDHPDFFFEARKTHVFLDANRATVALFGAKDKADFLARAPTLLPGSPESNIHVIRAFAKGHGFAQGERILHTMDGRKVPILWQVSIPAGRADRLVFLATNVTSLKEAEEALMTTQAELAHAARVAVLGELAASITHEVNQPLGAIQLFADTALRWIDRPEPNLTRARASIGRIARSAEQASNVIRKMHQFVRKTPTETTALDVREVLSDTLLLVERAAAKHQVTLDLAIAPDLPPARGDRVQLQQVLVNLTMNAIHSVAVQPASEREVRLRVELDPEGRLRFSCEDTGPGIAPHHLPKIFEPFFSTRTGGLGLGLAICRSIVEAHGGALHAENRSAGGALFQFELPVHEYGSGAAP